jgi:hypothetical protein
MSVLSQNLHFRTNAMAPADVAQEFTALGWNDKAEFDRKIDDWKKGMKQYGVTLKPCAKPFVNPFAEQPRHS